MQNTLTDIRTIDLLNGDPVEKKAEIRNYFLKTWELDEKLYSQLKSDDVFYKRGDSLRHIILFYLGHTAVFFVNKLFLAKLINKRIRPDFESIFAIGVDEMSWDDLNNNHYNWPEVSEVWEYRDLVKQLILNLIAELPLQMPVQWENPFWIIMMGIEHERIHIETSSVLIRQLPEEDLISGRFGNICTVSGPAPKNTFIPIPAMDISLGKPVDHPFYGWDNEYGSYNETLNEFKISKMLISNGEFLEFVKDKGYGQSKYWTDEGWRWREYTKANMPLFWRKKGDSYKLRLVADTIDMPWNWPVEVNYLEAKAYANWIAKKTDRNFRLPTEAEWYAMFEHSGLKDVNEWEDTPGNIQLSYYSSPCPVDMFSQGDFFDVIGNVWQWTETPITGLPGFKVHPLYDDFSTPTFDGKHNIIKGGSWISTGNEATYHSRYAFRRHFYQHAGFRLVESEFPLTIQKDEFEMDLEVANSCESMWGGSDEANFSVNLASIIRDKVEGLSTMSVLDLNCDTGRLSFELALDAQSVLGLDFSARFIRIPVQMMDRGFVHYVLQDENELVLYKDIVLEDKFRKVSGKLQFMQDNPNNLKDIYTNYDLLIASSVLENLTDPISFLKNVNSRLNKGGWLVLASDYNWENIEAQNRPGGFKKDGEPVSSFEGIRAILAPEFDLILGGIQLPLNFRINSRKSVLTTMELTIWKLKD